jgi:RNA polymerase sigma-70 factor (ECF subfamily)
MARETEEFESFFHETYPGLCRFLECMLAGGGGGASTAQDVAQESFMRLYREGLAKFPVGEARFWLYRVARNLALNELSKGSTRQRLFGRVVEAFTHRGRDPEGELEMNERKGLVLEMLKQLPEHQRAALLLREQEGMSYREIGEVLGVSEGKVKVDVFRARTVLRERWARAGHALRRASGGAGDAGLNGLPKLVL